MAISPREKVLCCGHGVVCSGGLGVSASGECPGTGAAGGWPTDDDDHRHWRVVHTCGGRRFGLQRYLRPAATSAGAIAGRRGDRPVDDKPGRHDHRQRYSHGSKCPVVAPGRDAGGTRRRPYRWYSPSFPVKAGLSHRCRGRRPAGRGAGTAICGTIRGRARPDRRSRRSMRRRRGRSA